MKNLAQRFLTPEEQAQIEAAVKSAESQTAGEIVCLIESASYHYPMANVVGAATLALPLALLLTPLIGGLLWIGAQNMWLFIGLFGVLFAAFHFLTQRTAWLKRWFISNREIEEEVEEAAITNFFRHGLYNTRDANGILIFISVFEHKVWVLADRGINAKVPTGQWDTIVSDITAGIRKNEPAPAIADAVKTIGQILKNHFPIQKNDTNELKNLIISRE